MKNNVTIILVSFYAYKNLVRYLNQFKKKFKIIIIDNSNDKRIIAHKNKNIEILINKENLGFGSSVNLALKKVKTKYALHIDLDTKLSNEDICKLINKANSIEDFTMMVPKIRNHNYKKKDFITKNLYKNIHHMNYVDGCCMLLKMQEIKKIGFFDKNIFLYFEETDLQKRIIDKSKKILMYDQSLIYHQGKSSSEKKYDYEIELNRNWHFMWSKFYFIRKHYGYVEAILRTFKHFYSSFFKYIFYKLTMNEKKKMIYYCRFSGCWNAIILKNSWYRPNIKIFKN